MMKGAFNNPSKILFKKERNQQIQRHQQRVRNMSAHVDTSSPATFELSSFNRKKIQIIEDRQTEIERENQMLLNKITKIMNNDKGLKNNGRFQKVGINEAKRKNELLKITMENQNILKRIKDRKSIYDTKNLAKQYEKHKKIKRNLCEYPVIPSRNQLQSNYNGSNHDNTNINMSQIYSDDEGEKQERMQKNKKVLHSGKKLQPVNNEPNPDGSRTLMKKSKKIGVHLYIIEVLVKDGIFRITADDVENPLTRVLEMFEEDGMKVLQEFFEDDIETLIDNLKITDKIYIKGLEQFQKQEEPTVPKSPNKLNQSKVSSQYQNSPKPKQKQQKQQQKQQEQEQEEQQDEYQDDEYEEENFEEDNKKSQQKQEEYEEEYEQDEFEDNNNNDIQESPKNSKNVQQSNATEQYEEEYEYDEDIQDDQSQQQQQSQQEQKQNKVQKSDNYEEEEYELDEDIE